jgi:hypothetical protein
LQELKPQPEEATIENKQLLMNLQANQKEADAKKRVCEAEEKECNIQRDEANALRADCQKDLDRVLPLLEQASAALDKITQNDMTQLKSYNNPFKRVLIVRIIRPDKFTTSLQDMISQEIGRQYIEPPPFNLDQAYRDSDCNTPLIFILSPGADPRIEITNLAERTGFKDSLASLSLGQGQGEIAEKAIKNAMTEG